MKQYTRSMERRGRGLTASMEHIPIYQTTVTGQPSMETRFNRKLLEASSIEQTHEGNFMFRPKTRAMSLMSKTNPKEAKVPTYIRWY